jgi:2,5-diketo-D-gluconate reductase B
MRFDSLGTWKLLGKDCRDSVARAIALGYRHIDTASVYDNESEVGAGITASGLPRREIFLTTKVWHEDLAPDAIRHAIQRSLDKLRTDYVDLFLIHWPSPNMNLPVALEAMAQFKSEGLIRHIGASNFTIALLRQAKKLIGAAIACNQIEYHLLLDRSPYWLTLSAKASSSPLIVRWHRAGLGTIPHLPILPPSIM